MRLREAASLLVVTIAAGCKAPHEGEPDYVPAALERDTAVAPVITSGFPSPDRRGLSLTDCLRIALENNRRIGIAQRRVLIADDLVDEAIASALPRLSTEGRFTARSNDAGVDRGGQSIAFQEREVFTSSVSLIVPIYSFGRVENVYDARTLGVEVAQLGLDRERQSLEFAVRQGYFRVLEAQKIAAVVRQSIEVVELQLEIARDFLEQDLVAKNDVLAVELQLAERRQELIQAENNILLARSTLNRLMGVDVNAPTQLEDVLEVDLWPPDLLAAMRMAVDKRPDLAALRRQIEIAQAEYRATRADLFPRIYAFGSYNYTSDDFQLNQNWLSGGAAIEWPIFDGGVTYTRLRRQERLIEEAIDRRSEQVDDVVLDVKQAVLNVQEAGQRLEVARRAIQLAEENLRITRDQYGQGLVTSADVLLEEDRLSRARSNYFRALYAYHQAYARLVFVIGGEPGR
ncbi:MAG: TolC family protein [Planctomycetes bacterium]|nr:TolC family protein [Planctomycetota bacterium]